MTSNTKTGSAMSVKEFIFKYAGERCENPQCDSANFSYPSDENEAEFQFEQLSEVS